MSNPMEEPFAGESDLYHFITQETRYLIIQYILAHPENLPSLEELDHAIPKGKSTIHEHLGRLRDRGIIDAYELEPERRTRDLPSTFYGLTEYGIYVAEEFDLLDGKGMLQGIYANMDKPEQIQRYEDAPRPERKSEADLREDLDDLVADDGRDQERADTMQEIAGITNLLNRDSSSNPGVEGAAAVRLELGGKILELLDSDSVEDREAAVSALVRIAQANVEAVVPMLSKLADVVSDLNLERQRGISEIFRHVSESEPDLISEEIRETLLELYDQDLEHWQDDLDVSRAILEAGLSISENVDSDRLRGRCHDRLGDVAKRVGDLDTAEEHYKASLDIARETGDQQGEAESLNNLGVVARQRDDIDMAKEDKYTMAGSTTPTVLVVENEPDLADLYATWLNEKYLVRVAHDGEEALTKIDGVDVVILDRRMPDLSGDQLLEEIRNRVRNCQVAILTAVNPDVDIVDMPFDEYMMKPVTDSDLIGLVEMLTERSTYDEQSQEYFSLVSKKGILETAEKEDTEEYQLLLNRIKELHGKIDATVDPTNGRDPSGKLSPGEL